MQINRTHFQAQRALKSLVANRFQQNAYLSCCYTLRPRAHVFVSCSIIFKSVSPGLALRRRAGFFSEVHNYPGARIFKSTLFLYDIFLGKYKLLFIVTKNHIREQSVQFF
jgi:hypothetical protein